ncbi:MAG: UvrD-helicase domain-containing protein [Alphaproteobacteria bacterium]
MSLPEDDPFDLSYEPPAQAEPAYLRGLNDKQREAVEALDGPVLVLAGAGTGKTRVLTTRLAHILATRRAYPSQILAVTFTNKAAREMRERTGALIGAAVEGMPWLGTFHSLGAKILRRHAELVGLKSNFTILDTDDQIRLIKQVMEAEGIDEKRWPARVFASMLDRWKNRGLLPEKVPEAETGEFAAGRGVALYKLYQERLKTLNAADFGDLLLENLRLFQTNQDVLADYQRRFHYMLVDEYQDTNVAQYLWLRLLAQGHRNICCVGDDDQSIYGWRGAEVDNILRFEKDFPGAKVIRLEQNYRSTPEILGAASGLIAANAGRLGKTLWTKAEAGDRVTVISAWDSEAEARMVGEEIEALQSKGRTLNETAILVRAGFLMRVFEERFLTIGLAYRVVGGPRFYERLEVRDAIAYLRVVHQEDDDLAFERIFNKPKRGLGDKALLAVQAAARSRGTSMVKASRELVHTDELTGAARGALTRLLADFDRWRTAAPVTPHDELAETVLDESGLTEMWQNDRSPEAPGRLENLKELVRSLEEFENLAGFLEHVSLVMEAAEEGENVPKVTLMTLHAAKGLEFPIVFLPGWEEGLFPSQRTLDEHGLSGLEEERRLAYVGLTRAKEKAIISFVANRRTHGLWQSAIPSRFIDELPEAHVETRQDEHFGFAQTGARSRFEDTSFSSSYESPGWKRARGAGGFAEDGAGGIAGESWRRPHGGRAPIIIEETANLVATSDPSAASYKTGERVFHQKFGYGRVRIVDGNKLTVDFDKAGEKRVIDTFVARV